MTKQTKITKEEKYAKLEWQLLNQETDYNLIQIIDEKIKNGCESRDVILEELIQPMKEDYQYVVDRAEYLTELMLEQHFKKKQA